MFFSNVLPRCIFILKCAAALLLVTQVFGCAAKPFEPTNLNSYQGRSFSVAYVPTKEKVHVEIYSDGERYSHFQISATNRALVSAAAGGLGTWAGIGLASAMNPSAMIVVDPVTIAANVVVLPLVDMGVELARRSKARRLAKPYNEILARDEVLQSIPKVMEIELVREFGDMFPALEVEPAGADARARDLPGAGETELVLVTSGVLAFSPHFEILQLTLLYGLYDREQGGRKPIYRNKVMVQSAVHAGKLGDTTGALKEFVESWHTEELQQWEHMLRNHGRSALVKARRDLKRKAKAKLTSKLARYSSIDDHDQDGRIWLEDDGREFRDELPILYEEAAYLLAKDLTGRYLGEVDGFVVPPGTDVEMVLVPKLNRGNRVVYRQEGGSLISIRSNDRMVQLSDL